MDQENKENNQFVSAFKKRVIRDNFEGYNRKRYYVFWWHVFFVWFQIGFFAFLGLQHFHWAVDILSIILIASRQHALFCLVHEAVHYQAHKNKRINDFISDFLLAYPLFFKTGGYRTNHFQHHKYTNRENDPDWNRKIIRKDWQFPKTKKNLAGTFLKLILGLGAVETFMGFFILSGLGIAVTPKARLGDKVFQVLFYILLLGGVFYFSIGKEFIIFWLVPLFLVFPVFNRIRSLAEHFGLEHSHPLNMTRNVNAMAIERFFFSPYRVNLHLTHHLFPSIPFYELKSFTEILEKDLEFSRKAHLNNSYIFGKSSESVFGDLQRGGSHRVKDGKYYKHALI